MPKQTRKLVLIAGPKSHGPEDNGIHDYPWAVKLLKVMLDNSNISQQVRVVCCLDGWPGNPELLEDADSILIISDGRDGHIGRESLHLESEARVAEVRRLLQRGCGLAVVHFSVFAPQSLEAFSFDSCGAYFDWGTDAERKWYSAIKTLRAQVLPATPGHPVLRGIGPFELREEFYFNLRFAPQDPALCPLWVVPALEGRAPDGGVVAWARERADGGRSFGTSCGHFHENFRVAEYRTLFLNALAWTAGVEVPPGGVQASFHDRDAVSSALEGVEGCARAVVREGQTVLPALMISGNAEHRWHNWERTEPRIKELLEQDERIRVELSREIEDLARLAEGRYRVLILNYCNWKDPRPLSEAAKRGLTSFLEQGGGLLVLHFANGAFHFSLPEAGASDWPEYRKIVRRVWNHQPVEGVKSQHDAYGRFAVSPTKINHSVTAGLPVFEVEDELYFDQDGAAPIEPLLTARSAKTGKDEPMAWSYRYGAGRIFQTLLGHSEACYQAWEAGEILRRAVAWVAGREVRRGRREES